MMSLEPPTSRSSLDFARDDWVVIGLIETIVSMRPKQGWSREALA